MKIGKKRVYSGCIVKSGCGSALISGDVVVTVSDDDPFVNVTLDGESYVFCVPKSSLKKHKKNKDVDVRPLVDKRFDNLKGKHVYSFVMPTHQTDYSKVAEMLRSGINSEQSISAKYPIDPASPKDIKIRVENIESELYSVKYEAFRHPHQEELDREEKESKGKYQIVDASDHLNGSRLFIHYVIESEPSSEFVCECNSIGVANVIVAALESFNDAFFTGSEG